MENFFFIFSDLLDDLLKIFRFIFFRNNGDEPDHFDHEAFSTNQPYIEAFNG